MIFKEEIAYIFDVRDPDCTGFAERAAIAFRGEAESFSDEHYLSATALSRCFGGAGDRSACFQGGQVRGERIAAGRFGLRSVVDDRVGVADGRAKAPPERAAQALLRPAGGARRAALPRRHPLRLRVRPSDELGRTLGSCLFVAFGLRCRLHWPERSSVGVGLAHRQAERHALLLRPARAAGPVRQELPAPRAGLPALQALAAGPPGLAGRRGHRRRRCPPSPRYPRRTPLLPRFQVPRLPCAAAWTSTACSPSAASTATSSTTSTSPTTACGCSTTGRSRARAPHLPLTHRHLFREAALHQLCSELTQVCLPTVSAT